MTNKFFAAALICFFMSKLLEHSAFNATVLIPVLDGLGVLVALVAFLLWLKDLVQKAGE